MKNILAIVLSFFASTIVLQAQMTPCTIAELIHEVDKTGSFSCPKGGISAVLQDNRMIFETQQEPAKPIIWLSSKMYDWSGFPKAVPKGSLTFPYETARFTSEKLREQQNLALNAGHQLTQSVPLGSPLPIDNDEEEWRSNGYNIFGDDAIDLVISVSTTVDKKIVDAWDLSCIPSPFSCCSFNFLGHDQLNKIISIAPNNNPNCVGNTIATIEEYKPILRYRLIGPEPKLVDPMSLAVVCENGVEMVNWNCRVMSMVANTAKINGYTTPLEQLEAGRIRGKIPLSIAKGDLEIKDLLGRTLTIPMQLPTPGAPNYQRCLAIDKANTKIETSCFEGSRKLKISGSTKAGTIKSLTIGGVDAPHCIEDNGRTFKWIGAYDQMPENLDFRFKDEYGTTDQWSVDQADIAREFPNGLPACNEKPDKRLSLAEVFPDCPNGGQLDPRSSTFFDCVKTKYSALIILNNDPTITEDARAKADELAASLRRDYAFDSVRVIENLTFGETAQAWMEFALSESSDTCQKLLYWIGHGTPDGKLKIGTRMVPKETVLNPFLLSGTKNIKHFLAVFDICYGTIGLEKTRNVDFDIKYVPGSGNYCYSRKLITSSGSDPAKNLEFTRYFIRELQGLPEERPWISADKIFFDVGTKANTQYIFFGEIGTPNLNVSGATFFFYHRSAFSQ